ncbi:unnamed protein product, partial [Prorocentrum cordatum]
AGRLLCLGLAPLRRRMDPQAAAKTAPGGDVAEPMLRMEGGAARDPSGGAPPDDRFTLAALACAPMFFGLTACLAVLGMRAARFGPVPRLAEGPVIEGRPKVIRVAERLAGFPPLCDRGIVLETCALFSSSTPEFWGSAADVDTRVLHAAEVSFGLQVARSSVVGWMEKIGMTNVETDGVALAGGAFAVDCQELCERTVASFADSVLPEVSDVACYTHPTTGKAICDIDVSPDALRQMQDSPEVVKVNQSQQLNSSDNATISYDALAELDDTELPTKDDAFMRLMVAQWFRLHPLSSVTHAPSTPSDNVSSTSTPSDNVSSTSTPGDNLTTSTPSDNMTSTSTPSENVSFTARRLSRNDLVGGFL